MRNLVRILCIASAFWLVPISGQAVISKNPVNPSLAKGEPLTSQQLWARIEAIYEQLETTLQKPSVDYSSKLTAWVATDCGFGLPERMRAEAIHAEAIERKSRLGLSFNGYYAQQDLSDSSDNSEEGRAYLELSWDILKDGYRANNERSKSLYQQAKLAKIESELKQSDRQYLCQQYRQEKKFSGLKALLYQLKVDLMGPVYNIERRAYFKGWSHLDDFLVAEEELLTSLLKLEDLNLLFAENSVNLTSPPVFDIDIQALREVMQINQSYDEIGEIKKSILQHKDKASIRNRLRIFVRNEFDINASDSNDSDNELVAGLRFSIPIEKDNKAALGFRYREIDEERRLLKQLQRIEFEQSFQKYQRQRDKALKQQYRYIQSYERARRSFVEKRLLGDGELANAIVRLKTLLNNSIELIEVKQELYRRLLAVFSIADIDITSAHIRESSLMNLEYRARPGNRFLYIWSSAFNTADNQQLADFLTAKGIRRVLLSIGKKTNREKYQKFIHKAEKEGLRVEVILGRNSWIFPVDHDLAAREVLEAARLTGVVHLDIEPHTLPGFKAQRSVYLDNYINMLRVIRKKIPDKKLTVAVPHNWPESVYRDIEGLVDAVYVMAYGRYSPAKLEEKLQPVMSVVPIGKLAVVLRVDDFDDEWAIERAFEKVSDNTGIRNFGLHQYKTFIKKVSREL
jgi:hypothetical protein